MLPLKASTSYKNEKTSVGMPVGAWEPSEVKTLEIAQMLKVNDICSLSAADYLM